MSIEIRAQYRFEVSMVFNRIFSRNKKDSIFRDDFVVDTTDIELKSTKIYSYLQYITFETFFGGDKGLKLKRFVSDIPRSIDEIIDHMQWTNNQYVQQFIRGVFKGLKEITTRTLKDNIEHFQIKGILFPLTTEELKEVDQYNKRMRYAAEDLLEFAHESLEKGYGVASFDNIETSIVWNSLLDDKIVDSIRKEAILSGIQQLIPDRSYTILDGAAGNGTGALTILMEALKKNIELELYIVESCPVLLKIARDKIDAWLHKNPEAEMLMMVNYLQEDLINDLWTNPDFEGINFDLIFANHTLQHFKMEERFVLLEGIINRFSETGRIIFGQHRRDDELEKILAVIYSLDTNFQGFLRHKDFIEVLKKRFRNVVSNKKGTVVTCYQ
ncbi:MAG: class I SAM-dependent methyltransferase [Candidatus Heimdallarchaeota archaeon]|nr:class I SAM-dependent methyltransferase [Candidatus Heimdallarchaeota archaeon]